MNGFKDKNLNISIVENILKSVMVNILKCCDLMYSDCFTNKIVLDNNEEYIRNYLYNNYLNNDELAESLGFADFIFVPEVPENYKNNQAIGRVDIKVFNTKVMEKRKNYFIIECKRIDGSDDLNKKYIDNGIKRFVLRNPKYSSNTKVNCMFGFVVANIDISQNLEEIKSKIKSDNDINVKSDFSKIDLFRGCPFVYESEYNVDKETLKLFHMFRDFSSLIIK